MSVTLSRFLGLDPGAVANARWSDLSIRWVGLPTAPGGGWWSLATLALVLFLIWHAVREYQREGAVISTGVRRLLTALRLGALVVALMILFQPTLVVDKSEKLKSTTWLLVDDSLSMSLTDVTGPKPGSAGVSPATGESRARDSAGETPALPGGQTTASRLALACRALDKSLLEQL